MKEHEAVKQTVVVCPDPISLLRKKVESLLEEYEVAMFVLANCHPASATIAINNLHHVKEQLSLYSRTLVNKELEKS